MMRVGPVCVVCDEWSKEWHREWLADSEALILQAASESQLDLCREGRHCLNRLADVQGTRIGDA